MLSPLVVVALLVVAALIVALTTESPIIQKISRVGGLAFVLYGLAVFVAWLLAQLK